MRYLLRHRHTTPFEMVEIKLLVRVPMDCWRQWIRHRTANVNEYSTRYSLAIDAMQTTTPERGDAGRAPIARGATARSTPSTARSCQRRRRSFRPGRELYEQRIALGVAREQARKDLPLSTYTEAYWKIDLHNLLNFLALRMDEHAQWEIRQYATAIGEQIVQPLFPIVWEAFVDYRLDGLFLSRLEREVIVRLVERLAASSRARATDEDFLAVQDPSWAAATRSRERDECREKLKRLNLL